MFDEENFLSLSVAPLHWRLSVLKVKPVRRRPCSPSYSDVVSMKSDQSMDTTISFNTEERRSCSPSSSDVLSMKSDRSMGNPIDFSNEETSLPHQKPNVLRVKPIRRTFSPSNSDVLSMKSDQSMDTPISFNTEEARGRPDSSSNNDVLSMKSDRSMGKLIDFNTEETSLLHQKPNVLWVKPIIRRPGSPSYSDVLSMKSDQSMEPPISFNTEETRRRPVSPSNCDVLSLKSDQSMGKLINFNTEESRDVLSMKSDRSMGNPIDFNTEETSLLYQKPNVLWVKPIRRRPGSPSNSVVLSMSGQSMETPISFNTEETRGRPSSSSNSDVLSMKSDQSMGKLIDFNTEETSLLHQKPNVLRVKPIRRRSCSSSYRDVLSMNSDQSMDTPISFNTEETNEGIDSPLNNDSSDRSSGNSIISGKKDSDMKALKRLLNKQILKNHEADGERETETELIDITAAGLKTGEGKALQNFDDLFKPVRHQNVRTVLTTGVARIGKTFKTHKMMVEWANGNSNKDIDLIVQFNLGQLNSKKHEEQSMKDLLDDHLQDLTKSEVHNYEDYNIAFILDELEKYKWDLDFQKNNDLSDLKEKASMSMLLTSLIKGTLLPSARLWIISQTPDVKIPPDYIDKVTECRETSTCQEQLISDLKARFKNKPTVPKNIFPPNIEHIMRENSDCEAEEVTRVSKITEIFKESREKKIRTVLTIEHPDIGETYHVEKLIEEWAKSTSRSFLSWFSGGQKTQDKELLFPLKVSKLCELKGETMSLDEVLQTVFEEMKKSIISNLEIFKVIFILDGLNSWGLPLDFNGAVTVTDVREKATVDVLLTNLIKGNLLPSAKLWITSDPSSVEWLPQDVFQRVTEIREKPDVASQRNLKHQLKKQFTFVSEGLDKQKTSASLKSIYTDLYIIRGERGKVNAQHESRQIQEAKFKSVQEEIPITCSDIFQPAHGERCPRTVFTLGMAGIGKTFASMKFILDWADGSANKTIHFIFPLSFRELNLMKEDEHSFQELIHRMFPAMKRSEITNYDKYQVLIILDGLDECRLDLNFSESGCLTDVKEKTTVNVLLVNLIKGNLLPGAHVWITTRPAASNTIPPDKVHRVTEVRGFNDEQKEEYFKKRFDNEDLVKQILEHVRKSRSIYIMCHIPVFCWITAKVLEDFVQRNQEEGMPKTLTDMYICFLLLQCRQANIKYTKEETGDILEAESVWNERNKETILSLAKVAFEGLEEGNFLFTDDSLPKDIVEGKAAVFTGLLTQVKHEGCGGITKIFYCFVHLSIQEFLAALHVIQTFNNEGKNLLKMEAVDLSAPEFYQTAVDKTLASKNGDWDLFLRFLLGLSVETNQTLLKDILEKMENSKKINHDTIEYVKSKLNDTDMSDPEKSLNLLHCLNELNDHSLVQEVKKKLQSKNAPFESFTAAHWSALNFVLLTSDENLDVFDLKKYLKSEKVFLEMLPVVKVAKTARLSWCELSEESCKGLKLSVLCSPSSNLTKLDLSHNDLLDSGVAQLAEGLKNVNCKLESLNLAGCQVTEKGCGDIISVLEFKKAANLKMLDLSYNHPGDAQSKKLQDIIGNKEMKLKTICLEHCGPNRLRSGIKKYEVYLNFDQKTAHRKYVFEEGRKVKIIDLSKHAARDPTKVNKDMVRWTQVFCERPEMPNQGLTGLCYWEVEWNEEVAIALTYEKLGRDMRHYGSLVCNEMYWSLTCSKRSYTARHGNTSVPIITEPCPRIAVFLDYDNGILSFYSVRPEQLSHIYTFNEKFTRPLFPGFSFKKGYVRLCDID